MKNKKVNWITQSPSTTCHEDLQGAILRLSLFIRVVKRLRNLNGIATSSKNYTRRFVRSVETQ